jgi:hypothetical protein
MSTASKRSSGSQHRSGTPKRQDIKEEATPSSPGPHTWTEEEEYARRTAHQRRAAQANQTGESSRRSLTPVSQPPERSFQSQPDRVFTPEDDPENLPDREEEPTPPEDPASSDSGSDTDDNDDDMTRAKVNPPDEYNGEAGKLKTFMSQVALYQYWNSSQFTTEEKKVMFAVSYMRGRAYTWIQGRMNTYLGDPAGAPSEIQRVFTNYTAFKDAMTQYFGNVDEKHEAEKQLLNLKQTADAARYAAEFQRIAAILDWNDEALRTKFFSGLKPDVKHHIRLRDDQPANMMALVDLAIKLDKTLFESKLDKKGGNTGYRPSQGQPRRTNNDYGPQPMELDKLQKGSKPPGKWTKKNQDGKGTPGKGFQGNCYNCGKKGHISSKCRQPRRDKPNTINVLQEAPGAPQQLAMLQAGRTQYAWGPNQRGKRDTEAARILLEREPSVGPDASHVSHGVIPIEECVSKTCDLWEHRWERDPGEPDWDFREPPVISMTQIRRILTIEGIQEDREHAYHRHLPRNKCTAFTCRAEAHRLSDPRPFEQHPDGPPGAPLLLRNKEALDEASERAKRTLAGYVAFGQVTQKEIPDSEPEDKENSDEDSEQDPAHYDQRPTGNEGGSC